MAERQLAAVERPTAPVPEDEPALADYLPLILRHVRLIFGVTLLTVLVTAAAVWNTPPMYRSQARVLVSPARDGAPEGAFSLASSVATLRVLFEGDNLAQQVVRAKGLDQPPYNMTGETFREQHLVIRTPRDTRVLEAVVTLGDPKLAAEVANAVCLVAIELWGRLAEGDTTASRQNLTSQTTAARERFAAASKRLQDFLLEHKPAVLRADAESYSNNLKQLRTVSLDADAERARLAAAEKELAGQEKFRSSPQVMRVDEAGVALRDDAMHPFMNPTYELLSREVVQARSRLAGLTRLLDEMAARTRPGRDGLTPVERSAIMESQLTQLQTEVTVARNIVDQIDQMYATAALRNLQSTAQVQIMDSALVPTDPLPRYRLQRIAGAGAAAFALAAIGAIAFQLLRRT